MEEAPRLTDAVVQTLETRVGKIEQWQVHFEDKFDRSLSAAAEAHKELLTVVDKKLGHAQESQERSRPTLLNILLAVGGMGGLVLTVVGSFGAAKLEPMDASIMENRATIKHIQETTEKRDELTVRFDAADLKTKLVETKVDDDRNRIERIYNRKADKDVVAEVVNRIERNVDRLDRELNDVRDKQIPRAEFTNQWNDAQQRFTNLNNRLDQTRHDLGANYTMGDQMKNLQNQLDDLRNQVSSGERKDGK